MTGGLELQYAGMQYDQAGPDAYARGLLALRLLSIHLDSQAVRQENSDRKARLAQKVGVVMDWKEQLSTVVEEAKIQLLDVRFICMNHQEKWFFQYSLYSSLRDTGLYWSFH